MKLFLCVGCGRHVKHGELACPFCGASVSTTSLDGSVARHASRAAMLAGAATMLAVASCAAYGSPVCAHDVTLSAACGVVGVTSMTCVGATVTCDKGRCVIGPVTNDCMITAMLGNGAKPSVSVTVVNDSRCGGNVVSSPGGGYKTLTATTCFAPEAGVDSSVNDAADDAVDDSSADVAIPNDAASE